MYPVATGVCAAYFTYLSSLCINWALWTVKMFLVFIHFFFLFSYCIFHIRYSKNRSFHFGRRGLAFRLCWFYLFTQSDSSTAATRFTPDWCVHSNEKTAFCFVLCVPFAFFAFTVAMNDFIYLFFCRLGVRFHSKFVFQRRGQLEGKITDEP